MAIRRVKKNVQLVIQSNDGQLLSAQPISELLAKSNVAVGDVCANPNLTMYFKKDGSGKYFSDGSRHLKQEIKYVQKMNIDYVLKNGFSYNEGYDFPIRLYESFIKIR